MNARVFNLALIVTVILTFVSVLGLSCAKEEAAREHDPGAESLQEWTCPMHPEVKSDEAGQCPTCNMNLVPVSEAEEESRGEEHPLREWTCEMCPEVRSTGPGSCPKCNMKLVPVEMHESMGEGGAKNEQVWICECCPEIRSSEPGVCPKCDMKLVPMSATGESMEHMSEPHEATGQQSEENVEEWTCGMHPAIRSKEPGKCPICNMDLVPVQQEEEEGVLKLTPESQDLAGIVRAEVEYLRLVKKIWSVGQVEYDERRIRHVASRIPGRIEKLYVDFVGTKVSEGEPLLSIYSPELLTALQEYKASLNAARSVAASGSGTAVSNMESFASSSRTRLLLWGLGNDVIDDLMEQVMTNGRDIPYQLPIRSPMSGTVIEKNAFEGKYVKEGEDLYVVADLSHVWITANIYEEDIGYVRVGDHVGIDALAYPGEMFHGQVAFIDPFFDQKTRTARVRIDVVNPEEKLKPGMYLHANLEVPVNREASHYYTCPMHPDVIEHEPGECPDCGMFLERVEGGSVLSVPKGAVIHAGERTVVYVEKQRGTYEPRRVVLGDLCTVDSDEGGLYHPVFDGLRAGEMVVTDASFLIDSQARLTGQAASAYGGALEVEASGHTGHSH